LRRPELRAQGEALHDKLLARITPVGWELISFNGDDVWPSEQLKQKVSYDLERRPLKSSLRAGNDPYNLG
jgi:hypothetical protein